MKKISFDRCDRALAHLRIGGLVSSEVREKAVADAIASIQKDGVLAMSCGYIGVKNYASFGDQREDHEYGMRPRHGDIVFRIERTEAVRGGTFELGEDHIYLLECVRDGGSVKVLVGDPFITGTGYHAQHPSPLNFAEALMRMLKLRNLTGSYLSQIDDLEVESHEEVNDA
jgi:hypothetical protein